MSYCTQTFIRILLLLSLAGSILAQTLTATLTLTHGISVSGSNVTVTFRTNFPDDTIYCCQLDDGEFDLCTSPTIYYNLPPGDHTVSIKAQAVRLGQPLEVAIAERNFTIVTPVVVQPLTIRGSARSLGDSVIATFSATKPATFQCRIDNGNFFPCSSPYTFSNLKVGAHMIMVRATATADPTQTGTYNIRVNVRKPNENFRVNGEYTLSSTNELTLTFSATEDATFRCRITKNSPPPLFTRPWIPCSDGIMYSNLGCGLFTAQIEATSTSNPSTKVILTLQQISIPCLPNCTGIEITPLQGTASVTVNAPNATLNIRLNRPAIITCRLNDGPQRSCHDKFTYTNLAVKNHTIEIIATSPCDPRQQIAYKTNITIGAPVDGGWGPWIDLACTVSKTRCGIGLRRRVRGCINPLPQNGGKPCRGKNIIEESCGTPCNMTQVFSITGHHQLSGNDVQVFFNASLPATFQCKLDKNSKVPCVSGHTYRNVSVGRHLIQVISRPHIDPQTKQTLRLRFNVHDQPVPTLLPPPRPPQVTATAQVFNNCSARLMFRAAVSATFRCRVNGGPWETCSSGYLASNLQSGVNKIEIEATATASPNIKSIGSASANLTGQVCPILDIRHPVCNPSTIVGNSFTFTFQANKPVTEYLCSLNNNRPSPCNQGTVTYSNLRKRTHVVTVTASTADGETVSKNVTFRSKYNRRFCQVYECSGGVIIDGNSASLTFISDDPGTTFRCKLNGRRLRPCASPLELKDLSAGTYNLDIIPSCGSKAKGRKQKITFTIP